MPQKHFHCSFQIYSTTFGFATHFISYTKYFNGCKDVVVGREYIYPLL